MHHQVVSKRIEVVTNGEKQRKHIRIQLEMMIMMKHLLLYRMKKVLKSCLVLAVASKRLSLLFRKAKTKMMKTLNTKKSTNLKKVNYQRDSKKSVREKIGLS